MVSGCLSKKHICLFYRINVLLLDLMFASIVGFFCFVNLYIYIFFL